MHFYSCQYINASIVQDSGMGPVANLLNASDLRPIDQNNMIFTYTRKIVRYSNTQTIPMELQHISAWATRHNLKLNETKSKKIVVKFIKLAAQDSIQKSTITKVDLTPTRGV